MAISQLEPKLHDVNKQVSLIGVSCRIALRVTQNGPESFVVGVAAQNLRYIYWKTGGLFKSVGRIGLRRTVYTLEARMCLAIERCISVSNSIAV